MLKHGTQFMVQRFHPGLEQQMRATFAPLHLLFFAKSFTHYLVHRGLHETCGNCLTVAISLAIIRDQVAIVLDIGAKLFHGFEELLELRVRLFEIVDQRLDIIDLVQSFVEIAMPQ